MKWWYLIRASPLLVVPTGKGRIMNKGCTRKLLSARLLVVPVVTGLAAAFALVLSGSHADHSAARQAALYSPGGSTGEPGEASLTQVERYWQTRLTYPTGRFDQRWVKTAAQKAKRIKSGIPRGQYRGRGGSAARAGSGSHGAQSIKSLAAARPLGP